MKQYESELFTFNSNIEPTAEQYVSNNMSWDNRWKRGQEQAKQDMEEGYSSGLSRYRLRCAHTFKSTNPFAMSYMNEYNSKRGNGMQITSPRELHTQQMLKTKDTIETMQQLAKIKERTKGHMEGPNGTRYRMKIDGRWADVSYEYFMSKYQE
jgi:hypothetical protein